MNNIDEIIESLSNDPNCSKYLLDWIVNRLDEIENRGNTFTVLLSDYNNGYLLREHENGLFIKGDEFLYKSFI